MRFLFATLAMCLIANTGHAQWGNLKGRILLDGEVPLIKPLFLKGEAPKDNEVCGAQDMPDESLVVDKKSKGIANVAVWLAKKPAEIHPDLAKPKPPGVTMTLTAGRIAPHVAVVHTGQTLNYSNLDPIFHATHAKPLKNRGHAFGIAPNGVIPPFKFQVAERAPIPINCDIHPWMQSYVLVVDHPYATLTDKDGRFEIKHLPAGKHEFRVWHETGGYLVKDAQNPKKGLIMNIEDGKQTILDDIKVPLKTFDDRK